jgi:hypothetical protein
MGRKEPWDYETKGMMRQVNATPVSQEELLSVIREVRESGPESRDMTGHALIAVRLYSDDPDKVKAIMFRLEALARLLSEQEAPGWTLSIPNGAVLIQEPVFASAAVQPLVEQDGEVAFEREAFLEKVLDLADLEQIG